MGRSDSYLREYSMYKETHCNDKDPEQSKSQQDMILSTARSTLHVHTWSSREGILTTKSFRRKGYLILH